MTCCYTVRGNTKFRPLGVLLWKSKRRGERDEPVAKAAGAGAGGLEGAGGEDRDCSRDAAGSGAWAPAATGYDPNDLRVLRQDGGRAGAGLPAEREEEDSPEGGRDAAARSVDPAGGRQWAGAAGWHGQPEPDQGGSALYRSDPGRCPVEDVMVRRCRDGGASYGVGARGAGEGARTAEGVAGGGAT